MSDNIPVVQHESESGKLNAAWNAVDATMPRWPWACQICEKTVEGPARPSVFAGQNKGRVISATVYLVCKECIDAGRKCEWENP